MALDGTPHLDPAVLAFLPATVIALALALARWLRLGSILGHLVAHGLIGPSVLDLIAALATLLEVAECGVVLMMLLVGLALEPRQLREMRRPIFGWGSLQSVGSTALLFGLALLLGQPWRLALVTSLGLAMSSTNKSAAHAARRLAWRFRQHNVEQVERLAPLTKDPAEAQRRQRQGGGSAE